MKVVLILFSSGELGGAERSLSRMAFETNEMSFKLATLHGEGSWSDWVNSRGKPAIIFGSKRSSRRITMLAYCRLVLYLSSNNIDVVYVCGTRAALMVRLIGLLFPSIKIVHAVRWNPNSSSKLDLFFRFIERYFHFLVDGWITNSKIAKDTLVSLCGIPEHKVKVIYNGLSEFPSSIRALNERPLEVLTVANLSPRKGHIQYLNQCVKKINNYIPDAKFRFIGRDDMKGEVQNWIKKNNLRDVVYYEGFQADTSEWYNRARVFVLPSLWGEGCPTSILEAMSYGVPCVSFGIDGLPELYEQDKHGSFVTVEDYEQLSEVIIDYLTHEHRVNERGANARQHVRKHFGLQNMIEQHCDYFRELSGEQN